MVKRFRSIDLASYIRRWTDWKDILRALEKLETMRSDMGSVNPVIAPQIPDLLEGKISF